MGRVVIPRVAPPIAPTERVKLDAAAGRYDDALGAIDLERLERAIERALAFERGDPHPIQPPLAAAVRDARHTPRRWA